MIDKEDLENLRHNFYEMTHNERGDAWYTTAHHNIEVILNRLHGEMSASQISVTPSTPLDGPELIADGEIVVAPRKSTTPRQYRAEKRALAQKDAARRQRAVATLLKGKGISYDQAVAEQASTLIVGLPEGFDLQDDQD